MTARVIEENGKLLHDYVQIPCIIYINPVSQNENNSVLLKIRVERRKDVITFRINLCKTELHKNVLI